MLYYTTSASTNPKPNSTTGIHNGIRTIHHDHATKPSILPMIKINCIKK